MLSWLMGILCCLAVLAGCGGSQKNLVKMDQVQPEMTAADTDDGAEDVSLTEELSGKRLEELYAKSGIPGWDPSLEEELKNWEHQVTFDVPIQMNKQVRAYLVYFSTERKEVIRRYLARSTRYLPMIKEVFQENGLPEDMAYLAMIESGFSAQAYSPAHASGMWQFIKGTGLRYGLAIDSYVDERRDPEKSTRAAAKYLLDLYKQFGSWYLAAASYNCGEGRVQRELNQTNNKNFWELSANMCLPNETKNYVPQLIAATIIAKNPEKFGFKNVGYLPSLKCDKVQVTEATSLKAAAMALNLPPEEVQSLNPELVRGVTPPETPNYTLNLPYNSKETFGKNITLARIEYPAVASAPVRMARNSGHSYAASRSAAAFSHSSTARPAALVRKTASQKTQTYAKSSQKKEKASPALFAKKDKPAHGTATKAESGQASPQMASIFGNPASIAKNAGGKNKSSQQLAASPAGKAKTLATQAGKGNTKKSTETHVAKKGEPAAKNGEAATKNDKGKAARKNGATSKASKDKYSKAHHPRALLVSEAR